MEAVIEDFTHWCEATEKESVKETWPVYDAQRIYLCRVCEDCEKVKLSQYHPSVLEGYSQADIDEPIEPDVYHWTSDVTPHEDW